MENLIHQIAGSYNYWVAGILMAIGMFTTLHSNNLIKKLIGLSVFQVSVLLFYISIGYVKGARYPILSSSATEYINPLPHVLMLTAIVVGIATLAVGLALTIRLKEEYGTIEDDEIKKSDEGRNKK